MVQFFLGGGSAMLAVLLFGVLALVAAVRFALSPTVSRLEVGRALSRATLFAAVTGVFSDLATVFSKVPQNPEWAQSPELPLIVMTGLSEAMAPAILGFALLAVFSLVCAVGHRSRAGTAAVGSL